MSEHVRGIARFFGGDSARGMVCIEFALDYQIRFDQHTRSRCTQGLNTGSSVLNISVIVAYFGHPIPMPNK